MTPQDIIKQLGVLEQDRSNVESLWERIAHFVMPHRGGFDHAVSSENGLSWFKRSLYDSTAPMAHNSLSSSLHGSLTNPATRWFDLRWRDPDMAKNSEAVRWLASASKKTYDTIQDSNFNLEINETYRDITGFGTGFILQEAATNPPKWDGMTFTAIPLKESFFHPDQFGQVERFFRLMDWPASKIVDKFGIKAVNDKIKKAYEEGSTDRFAVVFCVWKRNDRTSTGLRPSLRPWGFRYVLREGAEPLGEEGGYYENPCYAPRWLTSNDSVWGNSPASTALADIITLNQTVKLIEAAGEKAIDPSVMAEERALANDLDFSAGAFNVVRNIDRIKAFENSSRFDVGQLVLGDLRDNIRNYFFVDQLQLKESPAMTATEVQVRYEMMNRFLAGTVARLTNDLLDPIIQRTFNMLMRSGQFDALPDGIGEQDLDVEYVSPLARSQKLDQVAAQDRWLSSIIEMGQINPEVLMIPDWYKAVAKAADNLGVSPELLKDEKTVKDEVAAAKKAAAEEQAARTAAAAGNQNEN